MYKQFLPSPKFWAFVFYLYSSMFMFWMFTAFIGRVYPADAYFGAFLAVASLVASILLLVLACLSCTKRMV